MSSPMFSLFPLTTEIPKAMLPIANHPMIYYPLRWLEKAKINDIIIVTNDKWKQSILDYVHKKYEWIEPNARVIIKSVSEDLGTADILRNIEVSGDFIFLACDFITESHANALLDSHRLLSPTMSALLYDVTKISMNSEKSNGKDDDIEEVLGIQDSTSRWIFCASKSELEQEDDLQIRISLLKKFPRLHLYTQLRDAFVYVFQQSVLDIVMKNKKIKDIQKDLIPLLIQSQYRREYMKKEGLEKSLSNLHFLNPAYLLSCNGLENDRVVCNAVIYKEDLSVRAKNRWSYSEINKQMIKTVGNKIAKSAEINQKTQVGPDSIVGESSKIGERCSVKKSNIGSHCSIGKNVKISNSIIMDYVRIEDNVNLNGCIVCHNSVIHERANLKDCDVAVKVEVKAGLSAKGYKMSRPSENENPFSNDIPSVCGNNADSDSDTPALMGHMTWAT